MRTLFGNANDAPVAALLDSDIDIEAGDFPWRGLEARILALRKP